MFRSKTWMHKLMLSSSFAFTLLGSTLAQAAYDYKIHPGSQCQATVGAEAGYFDRGAGGFIFNTSASDLRVECPILRDNSFPAQLDVGIWVDSAFGGTISCTFWSMDSSGTPVVALTQSVTFSGPGAQPIYWAVDPSQTAFDGTYSIQCTLPPLGFVYRYIGGEDALTDDGF
jgi:hypothetical protein